MRLWLLGHAALLIESSQGDRLLIDPYESGGFDGKMGYAPIMARVDYVACTHEHADHCAVHTLEGEPEILSGERSVAGAFRVTRHRLDHDEYGGRRFGGQVDALRVEVDGVVCVHLSDVGHSPEVAQIEALGRVDVVCVPVGGFYTIGATQAREWCERLGARLIVPMHHASPDCGLPLDPLEYFTGQMRHLYGARGVDDPVFCVDDSGRRVIELPMMCATERARALLALEGMPDKSMDCTPSGFSCIQVMRSNVSL